MKNLTTANVLSRALLLACALGFAGTLEHTASAARDYDAVEYNDEDVVVVRQSPKRKRRIVEDEVDVVPASTVNVNTNATATSNAAAATESKAVSSSDEESAGGRIGKMINSKLDEKRRRHEDEMRRKQKEDEDRLISRIGGALDETSYDSAPPAQAQAQQVIVQDKRVYSTAADEEYEADLAASTTAKGSAHSGPSMTIAPNVGIGMLSAPGYEIDNGTAVGVTAEFGIDDNVMINVGYTYTQYEIGLAANGNMYNGFNSYYSPYQNNFSNNGQYLNNNTNKLEYNQNVIDAGMKYLMFDRSSRIRPYIGGGMAFMKGFLNYSQKMLNAYGPYNGYNNNGQLQDYEITGWTAYLQAGAILNFSDTFGVGVNYKYHKLIGSRESRRINNYGFVNNGYGLPYAQTDKDFVSGSLAESDFHTLGLSLNVSF